MEPLEAGRKTRGRGPILWSPFLGWRPQPTRGLRGPGNRGRRVVPDCGRPWRGAGQGSLGDQGVRHLGGSAREGRRADPFTGVAAHRCSFGRPDAGTRKGSCRWRTGRCEAGGLTPGGGSAAEPSGIDRGSLGGRGRILTESQALCEGVVNVAIGRFGQRWSNSRWRPARAAVKNCE